MGEAVWTDRYQEMIWTQIASKSDYLLPDAGLAFLLLGRLCFEQEQLNTVFVFEGLQK